VEVVESTKEKRTIRAFGAVDIVSERKLITLEWIASPVNDMFADTILAAILQAETVDNPRYVPATAKVDRIHFKECLIEMLQVFKRKSYLSY